MRVRVALATLATLAALALPALAPSASLAAGGVAIESDGPLTSIFVDDDLGCQVHALGDASLSFYGTAELGLCGTFLAYAEEEDSFDEGEGSHLWGPAPAAGTKPELYFVPEGQESGGEGTKANPLTVVTDVGAYEPASLEEEPVAELIETDSYVVGEDFYTTTIVINNLLFEDLVGRIYHAGHCLLAGLPDGFGAENVPSTGSVACTVEPGDVPSARYMAFTPGATSGNVGAPSFVEGEYESVWASISAEALQFPDTVAADTYQENAMGISWPIDLRGNDFYPESQGTISYTTTISPWSPPTSSATAGACSSTGQVPVSVSAVDGPAAVDYVLDGGPVASVPTNAAGQATIALGPGQHTLEYWGADAAGDQESAHHLLSTTVGAPSVSIASLQGRSSYTVGEAASVAIAVAGGGLTADPAGVVALSTSSPGSFSVTRSASNACGTATASFDYTVATPPPLPAPVLGKTVNVAPVSGKV